jgi:hypothetical protein
MSYKLLDIPNNITPISYKHNYNNIDDSIQRIFPNDMFSTRKNKSPLNGYLKIYVRDKSQKNCIIFTIEKDLIEVDSLSKCDSGSGTELLYKVEQFAREIGIFKITLLDASTITTPCANRVSLQMLSILTTGKSWYNKLGYICENQDNIDTHNSLIIQMKFSDLIDKIHSNIENKYQNELIKFETLIDNLIRQTDINFESTVQEVFIKIKDMLQKGQPCLSDIEPHLILLITYIQLSNILLIPKSFKTVFTKTLQPDIGKGTRTKKKRTNRRRTKNQKRTKTNKILRKKLR